MWQPWATLVAIMAKLVETRSWKTDYRGPLAIRAALRFPQEAQLLCFRDPFRSALIRWLLEGEITLPRGVIVATCELVDCVPAEQFRVCMAEDMERQRQIDPRWRWISFEEGEFGDYSSGRWGWVLENVVRLEAPVAARGRQGLWEWDYGR
jgi:hypothetical protein